MTKGKTHLFKVQSNWEGREHARGAVEDGECVINRRTKETWAKVARIK